MRQISLDVITAEDLRRTAPSERPNLFHDVLEQASARLAARPAALPHACSARRRWPRPHAPTTHSHTTVAPSPQLPQLGAKEEALTSQAGLYTLPSLQFLETLLDDMDSRAPGSAEPPLHLPEDAFDLPDDPSGSRRSTGDAAGFDLAPYQSGAASCGAPAGRDLAPTPFASLLLREPSAVAAMAPARDAPRQHQAGCGLPQYPVAPGTGALEYQPGTVYNVCAAAGALQPVAEPAPMRPFVPTSLPGSMPPTGGIDPRFLKKSMHVPAPAFMSEPCLPPSSLGLGLGPATRRLLRVSLRPRPPSSGRQAARCLPPLTRPPPRCRS